MSTPTFENKKAFHDYHVLETLEAGVVLQGWEVKAIRAGRLNLKSTWIRPIGNTLQWLSEITPLEQTCAFTNPKSNDSRSLLLHKKEAMKWLGKVSENGLTIVPLKGYFSRGRFKLLIGLVRGKKEYDKREAYKKADAEREASNAMKKIIRNYN